MNRFSSARPCRLRKSLTVRKSGSLPAARKRNATLSFSFAGPSAERNTSPCSRRTAAAQHHARVVGRITPFLRVGVLDLRQVHRVDHVRDEPRQVLLRDPVLQRRRQQQQLIRVVGAKGLAMAHYRQPPVRGPRESWLLGRTPRLSEKKGGFSFHGEVPLSGLRCRLPAGVESTGHQGRPSCHCHPAGRSAIHDPTDISGSRTHLTRVSPRWPRGTWTPPRGRFRKAGRWSRRRAPPGWAWPRSRARKGRSQEARERLQKARGLDPENASVHEAWGRFLHSQKQFGEAEAAFKKAIALDPKLVSARMDLGDL